MNIVNFNIISKFIVQDITPSEVMMMLIGFLGISLIAAFFTIKIKHIFLTKPYDTELSDFIPLKSFLKDNKTILCSNGSIVRVFKVKGTQNSFSNRKSLQKLLEVKKHFIDSLSEVNVNCRIITTRELEENKIKTEHNIPVLKEITDKWMQSNRLVFKNSYYMIISVDNTKKAYEKIESVTSTILAILDLYGIELLQVDSFPSESALTPFIKILNPISKPEIKITRNDLESNISRIITTEEVLFSKKGAIKFRYGEKEKYMTVIGIKNLSDYADEQMLTDILSLNYELNILQNFIPVSKLEAQALLTNQKRMTLATSFSYDVVSQYDEALASIEQSDTDHQTLVHFSQTIFIYGETEEELEKGILELTRIFRVYGMVPMRENWVAQASWFAQFPTYDKFPRLYRLLSRAVACLIDFNRQPTGLSKSDWGPEPITMFTTAQGTSYQFQFHITEDEGAVGHTIAIGPTGQGKTTMYSFLASQAMRFDRLKTFFFDRHRGAEIFTYAVDGDYIGFDNPGKKLKKADEDIGSGGRKVQLNPLKIEDNPENRGFIRNWLKEITLLHDSKSEAEIGRAVTTIFDYLEPEKRTLKNIYKSVFSPTGNMRREIEKWVDPNQYGYIFNAEDDTLNLSNRFNTFDFTYVLDDEVLAPAVISYIMNRIQNMTGRTGDPSLIIIDETAPMLANPMFRQNFAVGLQEGRKKRQVYLAAFQQPNIIDKLGIGELIRGQAQTEIFFRNTQAVAEDYDNWNFTAKEYAFIKGELYRDLKYAILFRKPSQNESVILNVDISGLGPYIKLFNSGRKNVLLAEEIRKKHDVNFVKYYLEQFNK